MRRAVGGVRKKKRIEWEWGVKYAGDRFRPASLPYLRCPVGSNDKKIHPLCGFEV